MWLTAARRLLHYVAELTGENQVVMTGRQQARLDEQHVAAGFGPRHTGRHARPREAEGHFVVDTRRTEVVRRVGCRHGDAPLVVPMLRRACDARGDLARDRADLTLEISDARFARVFADDAPDGGVGDRYRVGFQAVLFELPRNEIAARD